jgi:hypothetical protein
VISIDDHLGLIAKNDARLVCHPWAIGMAWVCLDKKLWSGLAYGIFNGG